VKWCEAAAREQNGSARPPTAPRAVERKAPASERGERATGAARLRAKRFGEVSP
jgi:hypothetical protein